MSIGVSPGRQRQAKFKVTLVNVMSFMPVRLGGKKKKKKKQAEEVAQQAVRSTCCSYEGSRFDSIVTHNHP